MVFGQFAASAQFFLWGKRAFTRTGWLKHQALYEQPDMLLQPLQLSDRVFMVSGANSGIGKEIATFLAGTGATVYMLCRSRARAEEAQAQIIEKTGSNSVRLLIGDVSLEADVKRCWAEFVQLSQSATPRLDALVCNAGALLNERTLTNEGVETTFACHLVFGTFLLGSLALPALNSTPGSRLVAISSGGMYNVPFPAWEVANATAEGTKYDGQSAYAYAKRGQVLLCERWAELNPAVKVVSCHPGWTTTPGVDAAYGDKKSYLEPLRSLWEGSEGIIWLCVAPPEKIESGAFYLDREPQAKHVAGPFFTEGWHTKNSKADLDGMMERLSRTAGLVSE